MQRPAVPRLVRFGLLGGFALVAIIWCTLFTSSQIGIRTAGASRLWTTADEHLRRANLLLITPGSVSPAIQAEVRDHAFGAFQRETAGAVPARLLGLVAQMENKPDSARRFFTYAEKMSRRDLPTQLWFIEYSASQNDIPGALLHYDRALRTRLQARPMLLPVLAQAASDPEIAKPLARMLAGRPSWWTDFMDVFVKDASSPRALAEILHAVNLRPNVQRERDLLTAAMMRAIALKAEPVAAAIYARSSGRSTSDAGNLVRDGGFELSDEARLPPFDWTLAQSADLTGVRESRPGASGASALVIMAVPSSAGEVARQLLTLPEGKYRLSAVAGETGPEAATRPALMVKCADTGREIAKLVAPQSKAAAEAGAEFAVSGPGCRTQWLVVTGAAGLDGNRTDPWIDSVQVRKL